VYDGVQFVSFTGKEGGLPYTEIYDITENTGGTIWLATLVGVWKFNDERFEHMWPDSSIPESDYVHAVMADPTGQVWFAGRRGVFVMQSDTITRLEFVHTPDNPHLVCTPDSVVWIFANDSLWRYSIALRTLLPSARDAPRNRRGELCDGRS
jgi:ligand-binding sensor domain-containing protein